LATNAPSARDDIYDPVTIFLHWATMVLVLAMFLLVLCPGIIKGSVALHKSIGLTILVLVPIRIVWRLLFGRKTHTTAAEPLLLRLGAQGAHVAIYALLIITPILGWLYQDAKAVDVDLFGTDIAMPELLYYDRALAMTIYSWKQVAAYTLLALICAHVVAAIVYHFMIRKDGVLRSMLPRRARRGRLAAITLALLALAPGAGRAQNSFDIHKYADDIAASLAQACPMASPSDLAAHEACRKTIGKGAEANMRGYSFLFGGEQGDILWLKDKKTSVFRGDLFQDLYMSLYMYTGQHHIEEAPDGLEIISLQAYFRNGLPPGLYPYPFWHNPAKWDAYEKANEIRFRVTKEGKVVFAYRTDAGTDENRGPYAHVERPPFLGEWMWRDDSGGAQPVTTLFSQYYSQDNPNLAGLDEAYRKMALSFREADCTVCHQPEGHGVMNKLTLLQTPIHAATSIDAVLDEVRAGRMPVDDYGDPIAISRRLRQQLLDYGQVFKDRIDRADEWERSNNRPKAHVNASP
jgi:cytochrome b561